MLCFEADESHFPPQQEVLITLLFCSWQHTQQKLCSSSVLNLIGICCVSALFESVHWMLPSGKAIIISALSLSLVQGPASSQRASCAEKHTMDLIGALFTSLMIKHFWITNNICSVCLRYFKSENWVLTQPTSLILFWVYTTAAER